MDIRDMIAGAADKMQKERQEKKRDAISKAEEKVQARKEAERLNRIARRERIARKQSEIEEADSEIDGMMPAIMSEMIDSMTASIHYAALHQETSTNDNSSDAKSILPEKALIAKSMTLSQVALTDSMEVLIDWALTHSQSVGSTVDLERLYYPYLRVEGKPHSRAWLEGIESLKDLDAITRIALYDSKNSVYAFEMASEQLADSNGYHYRAIHFGNPLELKDAISFAVSFLAITIKALKEQIDEQE